MIFVKDFARRTNAETGEEVYSLIVENAAIELVRSKSGKMYATKRSCSLSSTFDEQTCKALVGTTLEGDIRRLDCEPFEIVDKETGEVRISDHRYELFMPGEVPPVPVNEKSLVATEELVNA